jgi:hypothetical protein
MCDYERLGNPRPKNQPHLQLEEFPSTKKFDDVFLSYSLSGICERMSELNEERYTSFVSRKRLEKPASSIYLHERMASALLNAAGVRLPNISKARQGASPFASCEKPGPCGALRISVATC